MTKRWVYLGCTIFTLGAGLAVNGTVSGAWAQSAQAPAGTPAQPAPATTSWTGIYAGGMVGHGWMGEKGITMTPGFDGQAAARVPLSAEHTASNFGGGLFLGYNHQLNDRIVLGVEADAFFHRLRAKGRKTQGSEYQNTDTSFLTGSVGGEGGYFEEQSGWVCINNGGHFPPPQSLYPSNDPTAYCPPYGKPSPNWHMEAATIQVWIPGETSVNYTADRVTVVSLQEQRSASKQIQDVETLRARFGLLARPDFLLYATGGLAMGHVSAKVSATQTGTASYYYTNFSGGLEPAGINDVSGGCLIDSPCVTEGGIAAQSSASYKGFRLGWALGTGAEWRFADNWSARAEYIYYDLGSKTLVGNEATFITSEGGEYTTRARGKFKFDGHQLRLGVAYLFSQAPAAVVAAPTVAPAGKSYLVFFDWDKSTLTDRARGIIKEAAAASKATKHTVVEVNGYADTSGNPTYNMGLSMRRAQAVAAELARNGVDKKEIAIKAFGDTVLLVPTGPGVREPQNRRVEIIIK